MYLSPTPWAWPHTATPSGSLPIHLTAAPFPIGHSPFSHAPNRSFPIHPQRLHPSPLVLPPLSPAQWASPHEAPPPTAPSPLAVPAKPTQWACPPTATPLGSPSNDCSSLLQVPHLIGCGPVAPPTQWPRPPRGLAHLEELSCPQVPTAEDHPVVEAPNPRRLPPFPRQRHVLPTAGVEAVPGGGRWGGNKEGVMGVREGGPGGGARGT